MRTRDRNGIMIEECAGCRGVYLDRGELELLIDAESEYLATLPDPADADTTYQGRHRQGVVERVFGSSGAPGESSPLADITGSGEAGRRPTSSAGRTVSVGSPAGADG
jgi:Zn-finger nucleic acid-binding protein